MSPVVHGCQKQTSLPELELEVVVSCLMCGLESQGFFERSVHVHTHNHRSISPAPNSTSVETVTGMFTDLQTCSSKNKSQFEHTY